jgi:hypothetical protein
LSGKPVGGTIVDGGASEIKDCSVAHETTGNAVAIAVAGGFATMVLGTGIALVEVEANVLVVRAVAIVDGGGLT